MIKYHLIDLANMREADTLLAQNAFTLWKETYKPIFEASNETLDSDVFWRARILAVIERESEVVGFHLYNIYDLRCEGILSHSYIAEYPFEKIAEFKKAGSEKLMAMEYLTVNPKFRQKVSGIAWGDVIIGLGFKVLQASPWDSAAGIARVDFKVNSMAKNMGSKELGEVKCHDIPCKIVFLRKQEIQKHKNSDIQDMIEILWKDKRNQTMWVVDQATAQEVAA